MATKEAVFNLRVNTGNSVKDVQSFDQSIQNLNKDIQAVQDTASSSTGIDTFDAKLQELNAKVEAGGLTMRQMTQVMKEYQTIAAQAGMESPIGQQAIQSAAELKDTIGDLKAATTALSSDFVGLDTALAGVETGAAVFQGFESAVALTGVESEALVQTMVKLQAAQGLVSAATQIANNLNTDAVLGIKLRTAAEKAYTFVVGETTGALKILRVAMAATGIGALIAGVSYLVANFDSLKSSIMGVSTEQEVANEAAVKAVEIASEELNAADKLKLTLNDENVSREDKVKAIQAVQSEYPSLLGNIDAEKSSLEEVNKALELNAQLVYLKAQAEALAAVRADAFKQKTEEQIKAQTDQNESLAGWALDLYGFTEEANMINAGYTAQAIKEADDRIKAADKETAKLDEKIKALRAQGASDVDLREKEKKTEEQRKKNEKAAEDRRKAAEKAAEEAKKRAEEAAKIERERLANLLKLEQDFRVQVQQVENEYYDSLLTAKEREENAVYDKYFVLIQQAKQYGMDTATLEAARTAELAKITKDYNDKELEAQKVIDDAKLESAKAYRLLFADEYEQELISFEDTQKEQADALNTALANKTITEEEYLKGQEKLEQDYADKIKEINDKKNKAVSDGNKKSFDERIAEIESYIAIAQEGLNTLSAINDLANQLGQNRIDEVNAQAEQQTAALDKQQQEELSNANLTAEEKTAIEEKFNEQKQQVQLKAYNEEEKIKKAQFERDKAIKISQIAIDTASAIVKSVAASPTTFGLPFSAFAVATGIAQAATVAATKYKGGTPPTTATTSGGSVSTGAGASSFTAANTNTQQTNLSDILGGGTSGMATTSKVYVVESDITNAQQKVALQQQLSTY